MKAWFGEQSTSPFDLFSIHHLYMIIIFITGIFLLVIYSSRIKANPVLLKTIRWGLFSILVISELSYQSWGLFNKFWNPSEFLPLQLCSIAGILTMIALLTKNNKLIQMVLFIGIVPSFLAVITPELFHGFPHFRFWQFFIHHIVLAWASIFLVTSFPVHISLWKTLESYFYLLCYAGLIGFIVNPLVDANFLFLSSAPSANTPLNLLGNGFWYYFNLCLVGLLVFLCIYIFYNVISRLKHKKRAV
ncbi:YwaF family protein [Ornithinibacillus bavariensis]|uniref:YwaF family protein n=1 Tax=Ornithinibacillus bavariensis TaxID=545502 RepID=UPI001BB34357|nr:TIGR02206 family membrane protein [Ornithinibacillus bavariensis]